MFKKKIVSMIFLGCLSFVLSGCSATTPVSQQPTDNVDNVNTEQLDGSTTEPEVLPGEIINDNSTIDQQMIPGEINPEQLDNNNDQQTRIFNIIAKNFQFTPELIKVKKDTHVILNITSSDVEHSFVIDAYNINRNIPAGGTTQVDFIADKVGEFTFYSNIYSGTGTSSMKGKLIVE